MCFLGRWACAALLLFMTARTATSAPAPVPRPLPPSPDLSGSSENRRLSQESESAAQPPQPPSSRGGPKPQVYGHPNRSGLLNIWYIEYVNTFWRLDTRVTQQWKIDIEYKKCLEKPPEEFPEAQRGAVLPDACAAYLRSRYGAMPSPQAIAFAKQRLDFATPEERAAAAAAAAAAAERADGSAAAGAHDDAFLAQGRAGAGSSSGSAAIDGRMPDDAHGEGGRHVTADDNDSGHGSHPLQMARQRLARPVREHAASLMRHGWPALVRSAQSSGSRGGGWPATFRSPPAGARQGPWMTFRLLPH